MNRALPLFCLLVIMISFACIKPCHEGNYHFTTYDMFSPEKDSINVGDTLYLYCSISKNQNSVYFSRAENLVSDLVLSNIDSFGTSSRGAVKDFDYFSIIGQLTTDSRLSPDNNFQIYYIESDSAYTFKAGFIALKKGRYIFTYTDDTGVYRKGSVKCGIADFIFLNGNANNHLYLIEDQYGSLSYYDQVHSYCLDVK